MSNTPRLGMPYILASQSQKEVTHNEALNLLDLLVQGQVQARQADPPASPTEGAAYIVIATATGAWAGKEGYLAQYIGGVWSFFAPFEGLKCYSIADATEYQYKNSEWTAYQSSSSGGSSGASPRHCIIEGSGAITNITDGFVSAAKTRQNNTAYPLGYLMTVGGSYTYECTTAGTSAGSDPGSWPTSVGTTKTDGTVVWTCRSALSIMVYATPANPLILSFANGFDLNGNEVEYRKVIDYCTTLTGLNTGATYCVSASIDASTKAITFSATTILPTTYYWQDTSPGGTPATTGFWFDNKAYIGYQGNGAAWAALSNPLMMIGEVTTGASAVTSAISYATMAKYQSSSVTPLGAALTAVSAQHNIGVRPKTFRILIENLVAEQGYSPGDVVEGVLLASNASWPYPCVAWANRLTVGFNPGASNGGIFWGVINKTSGAAVAVTLAYWKFYFEAERGN